MMGMRRSSGPFYAWLFRHRGLWGLRRIKPDLIVYAVKEIFYSLQGEGARTGRPSVFLRFAGCNLWSGRESDRSKAICNFCDTDFVGTDGSYGGKYESEKALAEQVRSLWPTTGNAAAKPYVVCTGGEPLLQLDEALIDAFHEVGFEVAVETNGTLEAPAGLDWICMSPKPNTELKLIRGNELKFVYPQQQIQPNAVEHLDFDLFYLQPMDGPDRDRNIQTCLDYCLSHPRWRLSLQTHKMLDIR